MKTYRAYTDREDAAGDVSYVVQGDDGQFRRLRHLKVHSGTSMNHGYSGSGPADLALAILADHLGEADRIPAHDRYDHDIAGQIQRTTAWCLHQDFKRALIAPLDQDKGFALTAADIDTWLGPRRGALEREERAERAATLVGMQVLLTDGRLVDVADYDDEGVADIALIVRQADDGAWERTALSAVVRVIDPAPDAAESAGGRA